jgi:hypothetical protein
MTPLLAQCTYCGNKRELSFVRYGFLICGQCEPLIAASLTNVRQVNCRECKHKFSWLWGKYEYGRGFVCRACTSGAWCQECRSAPAAKLAGRAEGAVWVCESCSPGEHTFSREGRVEIETRHAA